MTINVSVVIPTYNSERWIEATLKSAVEQTYPASCLEIVVVDDASPDNTVQLARNFLKRYDVKNQVIALEKNGGVAAGRNIGWKAASHDWIQFVDGDDLMAAHKLALLAEAADTDSADVVYSNWQYYSLLEGQWQPVGQIWTPLVDDDPPLRILQEPTFGYVGPTLIHRRVIERVSGFREEPNLGEDIDLMLRMAMAGARFKRVLSERATFFYRQSPSSLGQHYDRHTVARRNLLSAFRRVEEFFRASTPDGHITEEQRVALVNRYSRNAEFFVEHDRETFALLTAWLAGLGEKRPAGLGRKLNLVAAAVGYENAVRLRSVYRRGARRLRPATK